MDRLPMTKRYIFILFCVPAALFARIPTADAYTVIVVSSSSNQGGERYEYRHPVAARAGAFTSHDMSADLSHSAIEQSTLERCRTHGGINPKIVLATR
jgi:Na+/H+ antiporter NhaB